MKIRWDSQGTGEPLLLIQGLGYGRWGWDPVVPGLAERYRVLTFDNRGIGESDKPAGPYTAREMADDALQVLDEAGVERAHVLGASLGGMIAQELAVKAPARVDKLVLCCTTPGGAGCLSAARGDDEALRRGADAGARGRPAPLRRERARREPAGGLVDELFARRVANPPDPAGWQAQAAAGTTFARRRGRRSRRRR